MSDRHEEGMEVGNRAVLGDEHVDAAVAGTTTDTAEFQDLITRYAWGEIWARPGLDRRTRSAITLMALVALNREGELRMHVHAALRNGLTREEIKEVFLQSAIYCGVPAANSAFAVRARSAARARRELTASRTPRSASWGRAGRARPRAPAPPARDRLGDPGGAQPRVRGATDPPQACSSRGRSTCSSRSGWGTGFGARARPRGSSCSSRASVTPDRLPLPRGTHDHRLRPAGGRQGPDRRPRRDRAAAAVRGR